MSFLNLAPHAVDQPRPNIIYAQVSSHQPAPTGFDDPLHVIFPQWRTDVYQIIDGFPAIHGNSLPEHGAEVVLIRDSTGTLRCVWWSGTHS